MCRRRGFEWLAVIRSDQGGVSESQILADADRRTLTAVARAEVVGCSVDWNRTMIFRELHIDEGKLSVAGVDACDERVVRHICFSSQSVKDSCLNARGKCKAGNSTW